MQNSTGFPPLRPTVLDALRLSKVRMQCSLLCSDIAGFTQMLSRLGDTLALTVVRRHDAIVRGCAAAHDGRVLELRGDGFLVSLERRADALACAVSIQRELASDRDRDDRDVRAAEQWRRDEIPASEAEEGDSLGVTSRNARDFELKGIPRRIRAVEIVWQELPLHFALESPAQSCAAANG